MKNASVTRSRRAASALLAAVLATSLPGGLGGAAAQAGNPAQGVAATPSAAGALSDPAASNPAAGDLVGADLPDAAAGMALYLEHCAACHGSDGRGKGSMSDRLPSAPPDFADPSVVGQRRPIDALAIIRDGRLDRLMPPWKDSLSVAEREAVLYAAWSFSFSPDRLLAARSDFEGACAGCHAPAQAAGRSAATPFARSWWQTRSQDEAAAAYRAHPAHAALDVDADRLRRSLVHARSFSFRPILPEDLSLGGSVTGRVLNRSVGGAGAAGATVSLVPFHASVQGILPTQPLTRTVGLDGSFGFTDLLAGEGMRYHLVTHYKGADAIQPEPIALGGSAPLAAVQDSEVWEPDPQAPAKVALAQWVLAPRPEEGLIHVVEAWSISNDSDRALVGEAGGPTLRFRLPPSARDLSFEDPALGSTGTADANGLSLSQPLPPGQREVLFSYVLPYSGQNLQLDFEAPLATDRFELLVVDAGVGVEGDGMGPVRRETRNDRAVTLSSGEAIGAGRRLALRLSDLPAPSAAAPPAAVILRPWGPNMNLGTGLGLGLAAMAGLVLLLGLGARRPDPGARQRTWNQAVSAIAALDEVRQAGGLDEAAYRRRRAGLVAGALAQSDSQGAAGTPPSDQG